MRKLYATLAAGIIALGVLHMLATTRYFDALTPAALWFFSGGMAMVLTGTLNLANRAYGTTAPGLRWLTLGSNAAMTAFGLVAGVVGRASASQFILVLGLLGGATVLSALRSALAPPRAAAGQPAPPPASL